MTMTVDSVQNYNITSRNGAFGNVIAGGLLGVASGYAAKHMTPLDAKERAQVPYRSIINVSRKETNKRMVDTYKSYTQRTEAQDRFIKMIEEKDFKNSRNIMQELNETKPEVAKAFKRIIKIADKDSQAISKQYASAYHKFLKCMRPNTPYVGTGAAIGIFAGMIYNAFSQNRA